jgi:hypothetical protein
MSQSVGVEGWLGYDGGDTNGGVGGGDSIYIDDSVGDKEGHSSSQERGKSRRLASISRSLRSSALQCLLLSFRGRILPAGRVAVMGLGGC